MQTRCFSNSSKMSNESSASETTPLRRPEERYQDSLSSSATDSLTRNAVDATAAAAVTSARNLLQTTNNSTYRHSPTTAVADTTVALANHNNNNIEIRISSSGSNRHLRGNRSSIHTYSGATETGSSSSYIAMDTNKRILSRVGLDVLILLCVGFPILFFYLWGDSYRRGFFCDDESLMHPFKESTVKNWMLYFIGLVIPIGVILAVEIIQSRHVEKVTNGNVSARRYVYMDYEIPDWMVECYKKIGIFGFGAAVSQLTTDVAKYSIGRLRPHFFAVCQPIMSDGTTCADAANQGKYIQDFHCAGIGSTERMIKESTLSFPSGHSSFTFYTMVYLALYLQSRMTWHGSKLMRHFLQFAFIMIAWYTALSRVSDYKHHWSDVLSGSLIGALVAVVVANYVSDLFQPKSEKTYILPRSLQDVPPQTITANGN